MWEFGKIAHETFTRSQNSTGAYRLGIADTEASCKARLVVGEESIERWSLLETPRNSALFVRRDSKRVQSKPHFS